MTNQTHTTIASELDLQHIFSTPNTAYRLVVDTRTDKDGNAKPIEETVLRKLANFHIGYKQLPMDFAVSNEKNETALTSAISKCASNVLVLTDQVSEAMGLCYELMVPAQANVLHAVSSRPSKGRAIDAPAFMDWREDVQKRRRTA